MKPAFRLALTLALLAAPFSQAAAQSQPVAGPAVAGKGDPADSLSIPVTPAQEAAAVAERERLNKEQAQFAAEQLAENEAGRQAYQQELREREATIARQQAEAQAAQQAYEAEVARREAEHEAAMARWRADVAACQAGDVSRCAASAAPK